MSKRHPITKRPSSRDPLRIQVSVRLKQPIDPRTGEPIPLSPDVIQEAIRYRVENGQDHPRVTTRIVRWKNPSRAGSLSRWRQGNQADAWGTLGKWLGHARVDVVSVRRRARARKGK